MNLILFYFWVDRAVLAVLKFLHYCFSILLSSLVLVYLLLSKAHLDFSGFYFYVFMNKMNEKNRLSVHCSVRTKKLHNIKLRKMAIFA